MCVCVGGWLGAGGGSYQLAGCAHLVFLSLTFGPRQVFEKFPTPPLTTTSSNVAALVTATLFHPLLHPSLTPHHLMQTLTNPSVIAHRFCCFCFVFLFFFFAMLMK